MSRVHAASLGVFAPAMFSIPQNPFYMRGGYGMAGNDGGGMGEFVDARFTIPQNPFLLTGRDLSTQGALAGINGLGCGGDCGCGGKCGGMDSGGGLGNLSDYLPDLGDVTIPGTSTSVPVVYLVAGGLAFALLALGSGRGSSRSAYRSEMARVRAKYPTRAGRAKRALAAARSEL